MQQVVFTAGALRPLVVRLSRSVLALSFLAVGGGVLMAACSSSVDSPKPSSEPSEPPEPCAGGVFVNDVCEGKCKPELCLEGNTCVGNRCVLKCDSHRDCFPGTQDCVPATEDDTKAEILVCSSNGKAVGIGDSCPFPGQCDLVASCPDGSSCNLGQCGGKLETCLPDPQFCGKDEPCTLGLCPDGSYCDIPTCALSECTPLTCVTSGEGDANAYCTRPDCQSDADCPGGYECGVVRDPHEICNSDPKKGNGGLCGETNEPCVDPSSFGMKNSYFEGPLCLMRKVCLKRTQCAPCETDLDCSLVDAQRCVTIDDGKHCARVCNSDVDCERDYQCDAAAGACVPRFGRCKGEGKLCEPCRNDTDCGGADTSRLCFRASLSGQLGCVDLSIPCRADAECPKAPNGETGTCTSNGTTDGECIFPIIDGSVRCW